MNTLSEYTKEQIHLLCSEVKDEELLQALETLPQLLETLRVGVTSANTLNRRKHKSYSSLIVFINRLFRVKKKDITLETPKEIALENKEAFNELLLQLINKLYSYGHKSIIPPEQTTTTSISNKQVSEDVKALLNGYQGALIELRKVQDKHSSAENAIGEIERHVEQALDRIGAEVVWERKENDYGNRFKVLKVPEDKSFQIPTPCIEYREQTICKGIYYITVKEVE